MKKRYINGKFKYTSDDDWHIDYQFLEKTLNEKTKLIIVNSPVNPTGK